MDMSDEQLLQRIQAGNTALFEEVVDRYLNPIYRFSLRSCSRPEDAQDMVQDIFFKVWKNKNSYNPEKKFKTWIFTIARNTITDLLRKKKDISFSTFDTDEESFEETISDDVPQADELFASQELTQTLQESLNALPLRCKEIIILHDTEGLTFEEIANIVHSPMNTVKSQYRRGIALLRTHILTSAPKS